MPEESKEESKSDNNEEENQNAENTSTNVAELKKTKRLNNKKYKILEKHSSEEEYDCKSFNSLVLFILLADGKLIENPKKNMKKKSKNKVKDNNKVKSVKDEKKEINEKEEIIRVPFIADDLISTHIGSKFQFI